MDNEKRECELKITNWSNSKSSETQKHTTQTHVKLKSPSLSLEMNNEKHEGELKENGTTQTKVKLKTIQLKLKSNSKARV